LGLFVAFYLRSLLEGVFKGTVRLMRLGMDELDVAQLRCKFKVL
jgi:hypothetical protein